MWNLSDTYVCSHLFNWNFGEFHKKKARAFDLTPKQNEWWYRINSAIFFSHFLSIFSTQLDDHTHARVSLNTCPGGWWDSQKCRLESGSRVNKLFSMQHQTSLYTTFPLLFTPFRKVVSVNGCWCCFSLFSRCHMVHPQTTLSSGPQMNVYTFRLFTVNLPEIHCGNSNACNYHKLSTEYVHSNYVHSSGLGVRFVLLLIFSIWQMYTYEILRDFNGRERFCVFCLDVSNCLVSLWLVCFTLWEHKFWLCGFDD